MRRRPEGSLIFLAPGLWLAVILLCLASSACFRYARIETGSSTTLEARIDRSDSETIFVTSSEGKEQTISRSEVVDIDHPGKARLTTGVLMVAGGAAMLIYGLVHRVPSASVLRHRANRPGQPPGRRRTPLQR